MTIDELTTYLHTPKSWIYDRTRDKPIPHIKIVGKYVRFHCLMFLTG
ncbi:MAG: helix-turn-helix domain-containing protein [Thermodesulfobacteriota bacterium]|nr:MAG: helix-turn-helix domain-containing protein [Thermodesulfobacteriota bacterium]